MVAPEITQEQLLAFQSQQRATGQWTDSMLILAKSYKPFL
jgi:hypothetical protein